MEERRSYTQQQESIFARSTIYKRHEARLMLNEALHDDPRPAPIRMLSRIPGCRSFFLPYNPRIHGVRSASSSSSPSATRSILSQNASDSSATAPIQSLFAAAVSSGAAYALMGHSRAFLTPTTASPFQPPQLFPPSSTSASYTTANHAMVRVQGGLVPTAIPQFFLTKPLSAKMVVTMTTLRLTIHDTVTQTTQSPWHGSLTAGVTTSLLRMIVLAQPALFSTTRNSSLFIPTTPRTTALPLMLVAKEMATTLVYCGLWEQQQMPIWCAGGIAGLIVHRSLRAAPLHALVFMGYDGLRPTYYTT